MLRAGQLNRLVSIEQVSETKGVSGDLQRAWVELAKVWSEKVDLSGRELEAAKSIHAEISVRFRIRYRADIKAGMRIVLAGELFSVLAPLDKTGRRTELHLMCSVGLISG